MKRRITVVNVLLLILSILLCSCGSQATDTIAISDTEAHTPQDSDPLTTDVPDEVQTEVADSDTTPADDTPVDGDPTEGIKLLTDIQGAGAKVKIACIGDSITAGTGITDKAKDSYPAVLGRLLGDGYEVGNFGIGGSYILPSDNPYNKRENKDLSYTKTQQYKDSIAFTPDVVLIMLGTNDALSSMVSTDAVNEIQKHYEELLLTYKELPSVKRVYVLSSILSVQNIGASMNTDGTLQAMQERAAKNTGCEFVDTFPYLHEYYDTILHTTDRLHPNDNSAQALPQVIFDMITKGASEVVEAPVSESGVVFVSGTGKLTNDGKTPETAVSSIPLAAGMLRKNGGTIVICGNYNCYKQSDTIMPSTEGKITVTSVYDGVDYRAKGAKLNLTAKYLYLGGEITFENINIHALAATIIVCRYNNVTFGEGISSTATDAFPIILAGYNVSHGGIREDAVSLTGDCTITVNSGKWGYIRGGNRRAVGNAVIGDITEGSKLSIVINGGEFMTVATQNINAATGMNNVSGEVSFTLNGGTIHGNLHAVCRMGTNNTATKAEVTGKITVTVNGGQVKGDLTKTQDGSVDVSKAEIVIP